MTVRFGITWSKRWHIIDPPPVQRREVQALCGAWAYTYGLPETVAKAAANPTTPRCKKCWRAAEKLGWTIPEPTLGEQ